MKLPFTIHHWLITHLMAELCGLLDKHKDTSAHVFSWCQLSTHRHRCTFLPNKRTMQNMRTALRGCSKFSFCKYFMPTHGWGLGHVMCCKGINTENIGEKTHQKHVGIHIWTVDRGWGLALQWSVKLPLLHLLPTWVRSALAQVAAP